jgi:hypothetical protein
MNKLMIYRNLRINSAFTPERGDPGYGKTYVKKENGICPVIDRENKTVNMENMGRTVYEMEGIFHPFDRVFPVNVPSKILFHYR